MQERMKDMQGNRENFNSNTHGTGFNQASAPGKQKSPTGPSSKDYIEFEEIK